MWGIGIGVAVLLLAWYALASVQSNMDLNYTVFYIGSTVLLVVCAAAGAVMFRPAKGRPGRSRMAWAFLAVWAVLIVGGEIAGRYFQSQEAMHGLESGNADYDQRVRNGTVPTYQARSEAGRWERTLDRMGPFVSAERKAVVRARAQRVSAAADEYDARSGRQ